MSERPLPVGSAPSARPVIMGVVNVTPDSFSDGGEWFDPDDAIENGLALWRQGAQILDVGGESTRPGAERPRGSGELRRGGPRGAGGATDHRHFADSSTVPGQKPHRTDRCDAPARRGARRGLVQPDRPKTSVVPGPSRHALRR